jgi:hypothetical protein
MACQPNRRWSDQQPLGIAERLRRSWPLDNKIAFSFYIDNSLHASASISMPLPLARSGVSHDQMCPHMDGR